MITTALIFPMIHYTCYTPIKLLYCVNLTVFRNHIGRKKTNNCIPAKNETAKMHIMEYAGGMNRLQPE